jgi:hypothetical protein
MKFNQSFVTKGIDSGGLRRAPTLARPSATMDAVDTIGKTPASKSTIAHSSTEEAISIEEWDEDQGREESSERDFVIKTDVSSIMRGKSYFLRARDQEEAQLWVSSTSEAVAAAKEAYQRKVSKERIQKQLRFVHDHPAFQSGVAILILANFIASMVELQIDVTEHGQQIFATLDVFFTLIFVVELAFNMATHWFFEFWRNSFNIFDLIVVVITTISLFPEVDMKVISTLRLLRAFRVVRIFARLGSARKIITALASSIVPVCNVLVVVVGMMCVFAMFGATAYRDSRHFESFSTSLYTMFRTLCLDGWASLVNDTEEQQPVQQVPVKLFFICYIFVVVYILMPVFVAAILDGYRTASYQQAQLDLKRSAREVGACPSRFCCLLFKLQSEIPVLSLPGSVRRRLPAYVHRPRAAWSGDLRDHVAAPYQAGRPLCDHGPRREQEH